MADPPAPHAADSTRPSPAPGRVAPGGKLGRYLLLERLGAGAMGVVFKARDTERGDIVALKTLQKIRPGSLLRFKNEFRSVANITHRNLVTLYELACDGDTWFFTMEYIPGRNLASLIATEISGGTRSTELPVSPAAPGSRRAITTFGSQNGDPDDDGGADDDGDDGDAGDGTNVDAGAHDRGELVCRSHSRHDVAGRVGRGEQRRGRARPLRVM